MKQIEKLFAKYFWVVFCLVLLLGAGLRFYQLTSNPPSLNWDEVAIGYNAYSILKTGKDEFGKTLPLYFRSLNDYKRPVYVYATVGSIAVFGMNDFAVRFPSAFFGTLTILVVLLLALELFNNRVIALLSAFFLAIVPWHVQFSRAGFEATIGLFLTASGVLFSLWGIRKSLWFLPLAALCFGLSMYSYLGQRVVVPILIVTIGLLFMKELLKIVKSKNIQTLLPLVIASLIFGVFMVSILHDSTQPGGNLRYQATSIFTHNDEYQKTEARMQYAAEKQINILRRVFQDSKLFTNFELVSRGYLVHFSPDFFFFDLGQEHHHAPGVGILYLWILPFLLLGIYYLVKKGETTNRAVVFAWVLGAPIAAAVTFQIPHALRVAEMIIPLQLLAACGTYFFFLYLWQRRNVFFLPVLGVFLLSVGVYFVYFIYEYSVHLPHERSKAWVYGRKEAVQYAEAHKNEYDKVIVSTNLDYPHIFFLYYTKYDPASYLNTGGTHTGSFDDQSIRFDKYEFHEFDYTKDSEKGNYLFIGKPDGFPKEVVPLRSISYLNGDPAIYIVSSKGKN